jgi:hypothetical protein
VIFTVNSVMQFTANFREMYFKLSTKPSFTERIDDIHCQFSHTVVIFTVNSVIQFTANFREMYFNLSTKPSLTERIGDIHCQFSHTVYSKL